MSHTTNKTHDNKRQLHRTWNKPILVCISKNVRGGEPATSETTGPFGTTLGSTTDPDAS